MDEFNPTPHNASEHLADWQRDAVLAAQGKATPEPSQQPIQPQVTIIQPRAPNTPTAQAGTQPIVSPELTYPQNPTQPIVGNFESAATDPTFSNSPSIPEGRKTHTLRKIIFIFGGVCLLLVLVTVLLVTTKLKKGSQNTASTRAQTKGRQIPSDCYQFSIPLTYEFDLSTTSCTLSGGDGIQKELVGVQPIKDAKTDDAEIKNLSDFGVQSFSKTYPAIKQTSQSATQFAGKPALQTTATLGENLQLTMYLIKLD